MCLIEGYARESASGAIEACRTGSDAGCHNFLSTQMSNGGDLAIMNRDKTSVRGHCHVSSLKRVIELFKEVLALRLVIVHAVTS